MVKYSSWKVLIRKATYVVLIFPFLIPRSFNSSKQGVVWNNLMIVHGTLTILCCSVGRKKQSIDQPSRSFMKYFQLIRSMPMQGKSGRCWESNESIRTNFLKLIWIVFLVCKHPKYVMFELNRSGKGLKAYFSFFCHCFS